MRRLWLIAVIVALASPLHAAVLMVTNTDNSGPGSLRDCVEQALPGDVVEFDPRLDGRAIYLHSQITINESIVIRGRGPEQTIVRGAGWYDGCWSEWPYYSRRLFEVQTGAEVEISGLTVRHGVSVQGGGILNSGTLTLKNCIVEWNVACSLLCIPEGDYCGQGGGILNIGQLKMIECTVRYNGFSQPSEDNEGAGIWSGGDLEVIDSTFTQHIGSDIHTRGSVLVDRSVFRWTGGVFHDGPGEVQILNSEFTEVSGNCWHVSCPSIQGSSLGSLIVDGCTITHGDAVAGPGTMRNSTITSTSIRAPIEIENTVVAGGPCYGVIVSNGHNISDSCHFGHTTDRFGIDPMLGPLQDNGGPTQTRAPLEGSPVIDSGWCDPGFDQRGVPRPLDGNRDGVWICDVGAVEYNPYTFKVISSSGGEIVVPADRN